MIHFYHVTKRFDHYSTALHDVTFHIEKGEFVFLTGASGAGKSTLLKLILRQMQPTDGQVVVNGRNLKSMKRSQLPFFRREIGMVFQDFKLIERMTVFENLSFILTVLGIPPREHKKRAYGALRAVSLHHKLNAYPLQFSGGEQQRIAIARALINDPLVIVADEPTGNLDPDLTQEIVQIFAEANLRGSTVLIATHDRELIEQSGRRVITLDHGRITDEKVGRAASARRASSRSSGSAADLRDAAPRRAAPENTFSYFFREAARRMWVSKRTSFVAVAMIAISLFIVGAFLLVAENLGRAVAQRAGKSRVNIYLTTDATPQQIAAVDAWLAAHHDFAGRRFVSKEVALARFRSTSPISPTSSASSTRIRFPPRSNARSRRPSRSRPHSRSRRRSCARSPASTKSSSIGSGSRS